MWLDEIIGYFSPRLGQQRYAYRLSFQHLKKNLNKRSYEGARRGRRTDGWLTKSTSANSEIQAAMVDLRNRARDLVRNNCYADKAVEVYSNNLVGTGIIPQAATANKDFNKKAMKAWGDWCRQADPDGQTDFYGLQELAARTRYESGECLVLRRWRRSSDGLRVPMQLEVLEPDYLDSNKNANLKDGNRIKQGIEYDDQGRRVAYWLFDEHPGESYLFTRKSHVSHRHPASDVIHLFRKGRAGQCRGVTAFAPAMARMRDLDDYEEAELIRKQIAACLGLAVTQAQGSGGATIGKVEDETDEDGSARRVEKLRPGMIAYFQPGETVDTIDPPSDPHYAEYLVKQLHALAAGLHIPYELLTGDLSRVNYSSLRAGLLDFRSTIDKDRWLMMIPGFCDRVWQWFIEAAYLAGAVPRADYAVKWTPPKYNMIDPLKDAMADQLMIRTGTKTLPEAIREQGFDPEEQLEEIARFNEMLDKLKIILDSDARNTARSGVLQSAQEATVSKEVNDAG